MKDKRKELRGELGDIVYMYDDTGRELAFEAVVAVPYNGQDYRLMRPLFDYEGKDANSAFVFKVERSGGETQLSIVPDKETILAVFDEYYKMRAEAMAKRGGKK